MPKLADTNNEVVVTTDDIPADQVIMAAVGELKHVVILGYDRNDNEYFASSYASGPEVIWLLERAKNIIINASEEDFEDD